MEKDTENISFLFPDATPSSINSLQARTLPYVYLLACYSITNQESKYTDLDKNSVELLMFPVDLKTFKALSGVVSSQKNCNTWPMRSKMSQWLGSTLLLLTEWKDVFHVAV